MVDLGDLTEKVKELEELVEVGTDNPGYIEYNVDNGSCFGFNLFNVPDVAIQRAFMSKGTIFTKHIHKNEIEIIVIYKGRIKGFIGDKEKELIVGDCVRVGKNVPHSWKALEDSWMVGITIPSAFAYPGKSG